MSGYSGNEDGRDGVPKPGSPREPEVDQGYLDYLRWLVYMTPEERRAMEIESDRPRRFRAPEVPVEEEAPPMSTISSIGDNGMAEVTSRKKAPEGERGACSRVKAKGARRGDGDDGPPKSPRGEGGRKSLRTTRLKRKD